MATKSVEQLTAELASVQSRLNDALKTITELQDAREKLAQEVLMLRRGGTPDNKAKLEKARKEKKKWEDEIARLEREGQ